MSGSDLAGGAQNLGAVEPFSPPDLGPAREPSVDAREPSVDARTGAAREPTGDQGVDEILRQLDAVADEPLDTQIEVGERVYQALQGRLGDLDRE